MIPVIVGAAQGLHKDGKVVVRSFDPNTWRFGTGTELKDNDGKDANASKGVMRLKSKAPRTLVQVDANNNGRWGDRDRFFLFGNKRVEMTPLTLDGRDGLKPGDVVRFSPLGKKISLKDDVVGQDLDNMDNGKFSTLVPKGWNGTLEVLGKHGTVRLKLRVRGGKVVAAPAAKKAAPSAKALQQYFDKHFVQSQAWNFAGILQGDLRNERAAAQFIAKIKANPALANLKPGDWMPAQLKRLLTAPNKSGNRITAEFARDAIKHWQDEAGVKRKSLAEVLESFLKEGVEHRRQRFEAIQRMAGDLKGANSPLLLSRFFGEWKPAQMLAASGKYLSDLGSHLTTMTDSLKRFYSAVSFYKKTGAPNQFNEPARRSEVDLLEKDVEAKRSEFQKAAADSLKDLRATYKSAKGAVRAENKLLGLQQILFGIATAGSAGFLFSNIAASLKAATALGGVFGSNTLLANNSGNAAIAGQRATNAGDKAIIEQVRLGNTALGDALGEVGKLAMLLAAESKLPGKSVDEVGVFKSKEEAMKKFPFDDQPVMTPDGRIGYYGVVRIPGGEERDEYAVVLNSWSQADFDKFLGRA